jgi:cytoskeletal protein CcmA (bactofilin family)
MAKNNINETASRNLLGADTTVKGDIESNGDFRIDGTLIGSISSKGKVVVGSTGNVEGEIKCQNAFFKSFG